MSKRYSNDKLQAMGKKNGKQDDPSTWAVRPLHRALWKKVRTASGHLPVWLCGLILAQAAIAAPLNIHVVGVDPSGAETPLNDYRWTVEEDASKASIPNQHATRNNYSFTLHTSYMPVIAAGKVAGGSNVTGNDCSDPNNPLGCADPDRKYMAPPDLNPAKRYYVSVLPTDGYAMGAAAVAPGQTDVTVYVNKYPLPTAQISVFVFNDNSPLNSQPDLPQEEGLAGFSILLTEAGGTYGGSGGQVTQDAFGNPLGTTYQYDSSGQPVLDSNGSPIMVTRGTGIITSGPNGVATIKNLFPAKYTIQVIPPNGSDWHQTTTIEGTKGDDAWVKNAEPSFFQEFGPPGHHVFSGFTRSGFIARDNGNPALNGSTSVTGRVTNIHNSRPPDYTFHSGNPMENCWIGLNEPNGGRAMYAAPCNADGTFAIPDVPAGTWEIAVWDEPLDTIISTSTIEVPPNTPTYAIGDVPVFSWFARYEGRVFYDINGNGFPDPGEPGIGQQVQNIRFRDGSIYQSVLSKNDGSFAFTEVFPFFNFMVSEVDYARFKATGATVVVDAGGAVTPHNGWTNPSFGRLTPQTQTCSQEDVDANTGTSNNLCTAVGQTLPYRVEHGVVLLEGMQTFLGQTNHIEWGKQLYSGQQNGGIAGVVQYGITRAEDNPANGTAETWEPGVPRVQVNLYLDCDGDGKPDKPSAAGDGTCESGGLSGADGYIYAKPDVDNYPFCWRDPASCGLTVPLAGPEDQSRSGNRVFSYGDVFTWGSDPDNSGAPYVGLGKTDGWDDAPPTECPVDANGAYAIPYGPDAGFPLDCYDGLRAWNQVRPAVFDGGYAFGSVAGQTNLPNVKYIVEAVAPPGYFHQGNGDKNVVFGDTVVPAPLAPPFDCVGMDLPVPQYLSLFPDAQEANIMYTGPGRTWKKCDMKLVDMQPGRNPAPNFFLYTEAPVAGHGVGFILDDLSSEFDVNAPTFGEKHAPPWLPVSVRDWTGREISRVYADEFGSYNFLVPSTFTINPPFPSGVGPSMMVSCMNSPGPIKDDRQFLANGTTPNPTYGQMIIDPHFDRQYSQFCYTLQYLPGKTTYLDTPVVPVAAFPGRSQNPLDCELASGTPMVYSVTGPNDSGPYLPTAGGTLTIVSAGGNVEVLNPYYDPSVPGSSKTITRDYGFGATQAAGTVKLGGVTLTSTTWNNDLIVVNVPANTPTGQLSITRSNGTSSSIGLTVTVGGPAPKYVAPGGSIQAVIDRADVVDGDLVIVPPGIYNEFVIMDKKIQLQGWGALSTTINAAKIGTASLKNWRALIKRKIDATPANPPVIDPDTGQNTINAGPLRTFDLLPGQVLGTNLSDNEPLLFGAEEGPGILVVGKQAANGAGNGHFNNQGGGHARIDGLSITGADYGGGILASGYVRSLEISNNRVFSNYGTYGGGIRIGHTELLDDTNAGYGGYSDSQNGCAENNCSLGANIHNNWISQNGSTESGAGGGVTLGNGSTYYAVTGNQICGNFSMADGGGIGQLGLSEGGLIANNSLIFNQTYSQASNPTGGAIFIGGEVSLDATGLSPGSGSVTISANLIQGNNAGSGGGGGVSLNRVNGLDVARSPANINSWNTVTLVNNMIVDNVAAYAGGAVSLQDALRVRVINNTIANNDSTATNMQAFPTAGANASDPQPAGVVSHATNSGLLGAMNANRRNANRFSDAALINNIIWHNRAFCWSLTSAAPPANFGLFDPTAAGGCNTSSPAGTNPVFVDLAVLDTPAQGTFANKYVGAGVDKLTPVNSILSDRLGTNGYQNNGNLQGDPLFVSAYYNGARKPAPILPEVTHIQTAATVDEGGNFIDVRYGPLTLWNCPVDANGQPTTTSCPQLFGNYHLRNTGSPAVGAGQNRTGNNGVPTVDYDNQNRPVQAIDIGADQVVSGGGGGGGGFPALGLLDNFNRGNANTLGSSWQQLTALGSAGIRVNSNQAYCTGLLCVAGANAYLPGGTGTAFGPSQGAAFTFTTASPNNSSLLLKATGTYAPLGYYQQAIRVRYNNNQVVVESTVNGVIFTTRGTLTGSFASGNTLTAVVDASGLVSVWKSIGTTNTALGTVQLPTNGVNAFTTGSGRVGLYLPNGARIDNFAGGNVP